MNTFRLGDRVRSTEGGDTIGTIVDAGETSSVVEVRGVDTSARVRLPNQRLLLVETPPESVSVVGPTKVYVLVDEHGDYSNYTKSVERVYASRRAAEREAERLNALRDARQAANNAVSAYDAELWKKSRKEYDALAKVMKRYEDKAHLIFASGHPYQDAWDALQKEPEYVAARNRQMQIQREINEKVIAFSCEKYPQFQSEPDNISGGYFSADQDFKVEEHDFFEEDDDDE